MRWLTFSTVTCWFIFFNLLNIWFKRFTLSLSWGYMILDLVSYCVGFVVTVTWVEIGGGAWWRINFITQHAHRKTSFSSSSSLRLQHQRLNLQYSQANSHPPDYFLRSYSLPSAFPPSAISWENAHLSLCFNVNICVAWSCLLPHGCVHAPFTWKPRPLDIIEPPSRRQASYLFDLFAGFMLS